MNTITIVLKNVPCKDCKKDFERVSRSRLCSDCSTLRKKQKKALRNKKYYKAKKTRIYKTDGNTD